jgi:predicted CXXCH cytochrome family protein
MKEVAKGLLVVFIFSTFGGFHQAIAGKKEKCVDCHTKEASVNLTKHNIGGKSCKGCHVSHDSKTKNLWGIPISREARDYAKIINANESDVFCLTCHYTGSVVGGKEVKDVGVLTHPTGNKLKCVTCHDPHLNSKDFLKKDKTELCLDCHKEYAKVKNGAHGKAGNCSFCHSVHKAKGGYLSRVVYGEISPMESPVDGFCLACHDPEGMAEHKVFQSLFNEHPLVVPNPTSKLPGKKISCVTCHDSHGEAEKLLRAPVKRDSQLCAICHKNIAESLKESFHASLKGECLACHTPHNPKFKVLWSREPAKGKTVNEKMCGSCHDTSKCREKLQLPLKEGMLPVNPMTGHIAKEGETGIVDCVSCHDPHGKFWNK